MKIIPLITKEYYGYSLSLAKITPLPLLMDRKDKILPTKMNVFFFFFFFFILKDPQDNKHYILTRTEHCFANS